MSFNQKQEKILLDVIGKLTTQVEECVGLIGKLTIATKDLQSRVEALENTTNKEYN